MRRCPSTPALQEWREAIEAATVDPCTLESVQDLAERLAALELCPGYLRDAIAVLEKRSARGPVGGGRQVVGTPRPFFELVARKLGVHFGIDLAAVRANALCAEFLGPDPYSLAMDSLAVDWAAVTGPTWWGWNNPEFAHVRPWVRKARVDSARGARVVQLLRLAQGTAWWAEEIDGQNCAVLKMKGRMKFPDYSWQANFDTALVSWDGLPFRESTWDWRPEMAIALTSTPGLVE